MVKMSFNNYLTVKISISGNQKFINGQNYTIHLIDNPLEIINILFIGYSRIDGYPMFKIYNSDINKNYILKQYKFINSDIIDIYLVSSISDYMPNEGVKESSYQKNSSTDIEKFYSNIAWTILI
jgi:hypothetical protein